MQRRNHRAQRTRHLEPWQPEEDDTPTTTEAMARDLVERGLVTNLILDVPVQTGHRRGGDR